MNARVWVFQMAKALALILVVGLSACSVDHGADQCQEVDALPESPAIAALGDSVFSTHWETCQCVAGHLSLLSGEKMWDYSAGGERVTHPTAHDIYEQYEDASREMAELKTVVFDGGGNDLLWECTQAERPACSADVEVILGEIGALVDQMILDGVETVVYVGYYQMAGFAAPFMEATNSLMDQLEPLCAAKGCTFIDLRPVFAGHPEWMAIDNVHPSPEGSLAIAHEIREVLGTY